MRAAFNILTAASIAIFVVIIFAAIFHFLSPGEHTGFYKLSPTLDQIVLTCIFAPFVEEYIFRHGPMTILRKLLPNTFQEIQWQFVIYIALIFGMMHGNFYNVLIQGIVGMMCGWVHIKNNFSYFSAVAVHMTYNIFVILILPSTI